MSKLILRILSALVLAPMALAATYVGGIWFQVLVSVLVAVGMFEWLRMCGKARSSSFWLVPGIVYLGLAWGAMLWLRMLTEAGSDLLFWLFVLVWGADTGAYIAGTLIGGAKLAPRISPNKTWAGLVGGVVVAGFVGFFAHTYFSIGVSTVMMVAISVFLGVLSQCGDLLESYAKRKFGVKDSGASIPGHGGVLDRVDGLLAAVIGLACIRLLFSESVGL